MRYALFLLLSLSSFYSSFASHIRAADIYAERISAAQYKIVLTIYTDADRVNEIEELDETSALLYFGKNGNPKESPAPIEVPRTSKEAVQSPSVFKNVFEYIL